MKLIINFQSEKHSLDIEADSYEEFLQKIAQYLGSNLSEKFTIKYKDEDDDYIILNTTEDYEMLCEFFVEDDQPIALIIQNVNDVKP